MVSRCIMFVVTFDNHFFSHLSCVFLLVYRFHNCPDALDLISKCVGLLAVVAEHIPNQVGYIVLFICVSTCESHIFFLNLHIITNICILVSMFYSDLLFPSSIFFRWWLNCVKYVLYQYFRMMQLLLVIFTGKVFPLIYHSGFLLSI